MESAPNTAAPADARGLERVAAAIARIETRLRDRPDAAIGEDMPAVARWHEATHVVARHDNGTEVPTDMPVQLGGSGAHVTPAWLFRAGVASCAATSIALAAAAARIELTALEVTARSRSDVRGLLGIDDTGGRPVHAAPFAFRLDVRIAARDASRERLRRLVDDTLAHSPIPCAVRHATDVAVTVEIDSIGAQA